MNIFYEIYFFESITALNKLCLNHNNFKLNLKLIIQITKSQINTLQLLITLIKVYINMKLKKSPNYNTKNYKKSFLL